MVWLSPTVLILLAGSRWPQVRVAPARSIPLARPAPCALFLASLRASRPVFPLRLPLRLLPRHWWALSESSSPSPSAARPAYLAAAHSPSKVANTGSAAMSSRTIPMICS